MAKDTFGLGSGPAEVIPVSEAARMINVVLDAGGLEELRFTLSSNPTSPELMTLFTQLESILNHRKVLEEQEAMKFDGGMPPARLSLNQRLAGNQSYQLSLQEFRRSQGEFAAVRGSTDQQRAEARANALLREMGR